MSVENICLRPAALEDAKLFFDWANEPDVRKNSFNTAVITWKEHIEWFQRVLADNDVRIFVLMVGESPAGQIRLVKSEHWQISYSIAPAYRGQGYGKIMIQLAEKELIRGGYSGERFWAEVKADNIASQRIFTGLGYLVTNSQHIGAYAYVKNIGK